MFLRYEDFRIPALALLLAMGAAAFAQAAPTVTTDKPGLPATPT